MFDRASSRCLSSCHMAVTDPFPGRMTSLSGAFSRPRFLLETSSATCLSSRDFYKDTAAAISGSYEKLYRECKKVMTCVFSLSLSVIRAGDFLVVAMLLFLVQWRQRKIYKRSIEPPIA